MASIQDLLVPRSRDTIEALLLSTLQAENFPVTDWKTGSVARTIMKMVATGLLDRETLIQYITAGGYLDFATTLTTPTGEPIEDWAEMLAERFYRIPRAAPTFTQKRVTLTCAAGLGPYTRNAGDLVAISQAGNYYRNTGSVTIPDGGSVVATFQAETPGSVVRDATGTIDTLSVPLPGVTILDGATYFSDPIVDFEGSGTITPSAASMPATPRTLKVTITASGLLSDTTAYYKVTKYQDGTETTLGPFQMSTSTYVDGDVTLTFADGTSGVSFVAGDTWYVTTPGESTIQNGIDQESLAALAQRCIDRWPALSAIPTEGKYHGWVRQASVDQQLGVNRVAAIASTVVAGLVNVYVADHTGTASTEIVTALQAYLDKRSVDIERAIVASATGIPVTPSGTVTVKRGTLAAVQASAQSKWDDYLANVPIGGDTPGGKVRIGKLWQALMDAGAYDADDLYLNGGPTDVTIGAGQVPTSGATLAAGLTWLEVA